MSHFLLGLGRELKCLAEQLLIALATLLPGRGYFYALRLFSRFHAWFVDLQPAADKLHAWLPAHGRAEVVRGLALHRLVDMADFYLTLWHGRRWFERHVQVSGKLPVVVPEADRAAMMCTFHYGQGFWALPWFRQRGWQCAFLHLPPPPAAQAAWGGRLAAWLGHKRIAQVARLGGAKGIAVGGSMQRMRERFRKEHQAVLVMPDVPSSPEQPCLEVSLLGRRARFPAGAISLAAAEGVPVYIYTMALDRRSGLRHLQLHGPFQGDEPQVLAAHLAHYLDRALSQDPTAWHLWAWVDHFMYSEKH